MKKIVLSALLLAAVALSASATMFPGIGPAAGHTGTTFTQWEYTFNPYGPQCKKAGVYFNAFKLTFNECSDGHSRVCWLVQ